MIYLIALGVGLGVANTAVAVHLWWARSRTWTYAARMARSFDVTDPRSQAYSDMCSAIALDGKVPCPHLRQRGIYGDEIRYANWNRAECLVCGCRLPDLPEAERSTQ